MPPGTLRASSRRAPSSLALYTWLGIVATGWMLVPHGAALRSLVAAPLLEEIVFRWGVQDALAARLPSRLPAAVPLLAALLFAAAHVALAGASDAPRAAATLFPAWWIGVLYRRDRALVACVAWHAAFNLAWIAALQPALAT